LDGQRPRDRDPRGAHQLVLLELEDVLGGGRWRVDKRRARTFEPHDEAETNDRRSRHAAYARFVALTSVVTQPRWSPWRSGWKGSGCDIERMYHVITAAMSTSHR
jgi:hypothetical protein